MRHGLRLVLIAAIITPQAVSAAGTSSWNPSYGRLAVTQSVAARCRDAEDADDCAKAIERHQASQCRFTRSGDLLTVPDCRRPDASPSILGRSRSTCRG